MFFFVSDVTGCLRFVTKFRFIDPLFFFLIVHLLIYLHMYMILYFIFMITVKSYKSRNRWDRDRMVVGFTTTYAISVYHH